MLVAQVMIGKTFSQKKKSSKETSQNDDQRAMAMSVSSNLKARGEKLPLVSETRCCAAVASPLFFNGPSTQDLRQPAFKGWRSCGLPCRQHCRTTTMLVVLLKSDLARFVFKIPLFRRVQPDGRWHWIALLEAAVPSTQRHSQPRSVVDIFEARLLHFLLDCLRSRALLQRH